MNEVQYTKDYITIVEALKGTGFDDTGFFTIQQIDEYIEREKLAERFTSFDIVNFRNRLIERMTGRLHYFHKYILPGPCGADYVRSVIMSTMATGFEHYRKLKLLLNEGEVSFGGDARNGSFVLIDYLMHFWSKKTSWRDLKFIFSSESVETRMFIETSSVSFEYFYDTPKSIMASSMKGNSIYINEFADKDELYDFIIKVATFQKNIKIEDEQT